MLVVEREKLRKKVAWEERDFISVVVSHHPTLTFNW